MNNLPLQPLVWSETERFDTPFASNSALHDYQLQEVLKHKRYQVAYTPLDLSEPQKIATGFYTIHDAKEFAWNHYNEKMQAYVKPLPTWIDAKKQLPKVDVDTQFICAYDSAIEPYVRVATFSVEFGDFGAEYEGVLAWMPIPDFKESDCE